MHGGHGTRLRPLTFTGNKHMLPLANKPMLQYGLEHLKNAGIQALSHYFPLHSSPYFKDIYNGPELPNTQRFSDTILRLPFYHSLKQREIEDIVTKIEG